MLKKRITWKIEKRKLADLKPHPKNPRQFTEKGMKDLENSINSIGFMQPININQDGTILSGHARTLKLKEMGETEADVYVPDRMLTPKQEEEVLVRANANTAGKWDWDLLANNFELEEINEWGLEIPDMQIEVEELETKLEAKEDDFDGTPPEQPKTILGDLYEIGEHRLLCGDSTQTNTFEKLMNGELADMVVTDPPYNVAYEGGTKDALTMQNDSMGSDDFYKFLYDFYVALTSAVKKGGAIYVWHGLSEVINFGKAMVDAGWLLKQQLIWVKNTMVLGRQDYQWKHEPCLYGWLAGDSHKWYSDRKQTTVIDFDRPKRNGEHPTMKPIGLFGYQIENSSKIGDLVIDAFGGSGTTMVACEQLKRKARVIELDPKYCDVIIKRMIKLDPSLKLTRNGEDCKNEFIKDNG